MLPYSNTIARFTFESSRQLRGTNSRGAPPRDYIDNTFILFRTCHIECDGVMQRGPAYHASILLLCGFHMMDPLAEDMEFWRLFDTWQHFCSSGTSAGLVPGLLMEKNP
jgi:hypothetical protein